MFFQGEFVQRRAFVFMAVAALVLLTGCGSDASSTDSSPTSPDITNVSSTVSSRPSVNIIGDSVTAESKAKITLDEFDLFIYAVFGITIEEQLPAIQAAIARSPHVLVIQLGGNDMGHWGPSIVAEVNQILDAAAGLDCVRWVNLVSLSTHASEFNGLLAGQALVRDNFAVIDWIQATAEHPSWLGPDGVHPSDPDGQIGFAAIVAESVRACPL